MKGPPINPPLRPSSALGFPSEIQKPPLLNPPSRVAILADLRCQARTAQQALAGEPEADVLLPLLDNLDRQIAVVLQRIGVLK